MDAQIFGHCKNIHIEDFIDKYISCDSTLLDANLVKMQTHHHTKTCKKYKTSTCRFNFPLPPMRQTTILEPLSNPDPTIKDRAKLFFKQLETKHYTKNVTFDDFLYEFQLEETDYIAILQATLSRRIVLLKRQPADIWINSFSRKVPTLWYANTDTQFILDAYDIASYCSSYMTKQDTTLSRAFNQI
jgi:hypothetical protein